MEDKTFTELCMDFINENREKCPDLLMPRFRNVAKDPPFPNGLYHLNYDRLNFKAFLKCKYPQADLHTSTYSSDSLLKDLMTTHSEYTFYDTRYFFQTWGSLMTVSFLSMKYYQDEIDLRGRHPKSDKIDEPVLVVQYSNVNVLFNGYHRASYHMLIGKENIQAYVLQA